MLTEKACITGAAAARAWDGVHNYRVIRPEVGAVIGGLRIDAVAGRGGMGVVFKAHQLALDRTVAMKIVNPELASDPEFRERFRREARLAAALDHPHVVPVLSAGEEDGHLFLVMRFVDGTDLATMLATQGRLDPRDAAEIVAQVGSALDAAHTRGLVHRDVKPANVLVTRPAGRWHAFLTDFGITKELAGSGMTRSGLVVGSLDYIAPEALAGDPVDGRADVYSLGCVLFESLTGSVPFPRDNSAAKMYAHMHTPAPSLTLPWLGPPFDAVMARALAKRPAERFAAAGELGQAARAAAAGAPVGTPVGSSSPWQYSGAAEWPPWTPEPGYFTGRPGTPPPLTEVGAERPARGRRWVWGVVAGVVAVAVAATVTIVALRGSPGPGPGPVPPTTTQVATPAPATNLPAAGQVEGAPIAVGVGPADVLGGGGFVWTANSDAGSVTRIDPASGATAEFRVDGQPGTTVAGHGKIWVWNWSSAVTPVDVATGQVGDLVRTELDFAAVAAGPDYLWFTAPATNVVGRIDMRTGQFDTRTIPVGRRPGPIAVDGGKVYVLNREDRSLTTIDEQSATVIGEPRSLPDGAAILGAGFGHVYVSGGGKITPVGDGPIGAGSAATPVWASGWAIGTTGLWWVDGEGGKMTRTGYDLGPPVAELTGLGPIEDADEIDGAMWLANGTANTATRVRLSGS